MLGVYGGACVCDTHGFAGRGHTSIEISVLPLRPASRDCHEICIHPLYTYRVSEYENGTPFSYTDIPLTIEGPVTRGEIRRIMLVHLLVYLPGREGLSDDQLGLQITRN